MCSGGEERGKWDLLMASGEFIDLGESRSEITWTNKQEGDRAISKRLDRWYLVNSPENSRRVRFRVCSERVLSDHYPIWGEIGGREGDKKSQSRFRADPKWFEISGLQRTFKTIWDLDTGIAKANILRKWADKIKRIRRIIQEISVFGLRRRIKIGRLG